MPEWISWAILMFLVYRVGRLSGEKDALYSTVRVLLIDLDGNVRDERTTRIRGGENVDIPVVCLPLGSYRNYLEDDFPFLRN